MNGKYFIVLINKIVKGYGTVIPLSACRNLILRHPIAVSGETATYAQVVTERANTVGLFVGAKLKYKPRVCPRAQQIGSIAG